MIASQMDIGWMSKMSAFKVLTRLVAEQPVVALDVISASRSACSSVVAPASKPAVIPFLAKAHP